MTDHESSGRRLAQLPGWRWAILLICCAALAAAFAVWRDSGRLGRLKALYAAPAVIPSAPGGPLGPARAELGRRLFFDTTLSGSGTTACVTCHQPGRSWADGRPRAIGDRGHSLALRSPTLIDVAWTPLLGWDGKFADIEAVTFAAITAAGNMNLSQADALARVAANPFYVADFARDFPDGRISAGNVARALAGFERLIVSTPATPFDRWIAGDGDAIGAAAQRGFALFNGRAHCAECHGGWAFTDGSFHDIGTATGADIGRGKYFPGSLKLRFAFKTPTLRDVAERGPYMHNGSVATLADVIELYDKGGIDRPSRADEIGPLHMSEREKADLLSFLGSLSGPTRADGALQDKAASEPLQRHAEQGQAADQQQAAARLQQPGMAGGTPAGVEQAATEQH